MPSVNPEVSSVIYCWLRAGGKGLPAHHQVFFAFRQMSYSESKCFLEGVYRPKVSLEASVSWQLQLCTCDAASQVFRCSQYMKFVTLAVKDCPHITKFSLRFCRCPTVNVLTLRLLMSYLYMEHLFLMFLDHTQRRSTVGRTPLDE